jgi:hypothetical protein
VEVTAMYKAIFILGTLASLFLSLNASAFTTRHCETGDQRVTVNLLFDAADNYFVNGVLNVGDQETMGILQGSDHIRPRMEIDPNHSPLTIVFGDDDFILSLDAKTASLTSSQGLIQTMRCCSGDVCF